jgi:hypothetical protein
MQTFGPVNISDELMRKLKEKVREVNALPEDHPTRRWLTPTHRNFVSVHALGRAALAWLVETLDNQNPTGLAQSETTLPPAVPSKEELP